MTVRMSTTGFSFSMSRGERGELILTDELNALTYVRDLGHGSEWQRLKDDGTRVAAAMQPDAWALVRDLEAMFLDDEMRTRVSERAQREGVHEETAAWHIYVNGGEGERLRLERLYPSLGNYEHTKGAA